MQSIVPSVQERLLQREADRPAEYQGYISGLKRLWFDRLEQPQRIVELGTWIGNSAFAWLSSFTDEKAWLHSVDVTGDNSKPIIVDAQNYGWDKWLHLVREDSLAYAEQWKGSVEKPSMIYVDTTHEFNRTLRELEAWVPHLKPGGFLVLDDACGYPSVLDAFLEYYRAHRDRVDWFTLFTGLPYTPKSHGLLVARLE